jgi:NitT/TauT family transport system substrate-binding protein
VPSNLASVLYNKTEGQVVAVSPIALGVLYILGNDVDLDSVADLKGKTIVASGQGGTPEYVLQKVLENAGLTIYEDVQVQWLANHAEVNTKLLTQEDTIAMIPEPFVSTALAAGNDDVEVEFDMNQLWKDATGQELPMGVLVATKSFVTERENDLKVLLNDLQASVDFVNESQDEAAKLIVEKGFIGKEPIAKAAIPNCHIVLYTGDNAEAGKDILKTFNQTLFEMNKASVGGSLPGDELYY